MNEALDEEIGSINAIYEADVLSKESTSLLLLDVPGAVVKLRISVPDDYPTTCLTIEGPETSGAGLRKGQASEFAQKARDVLKGTFREGEPSMFDLIEELKDHARSQHGEAAEIHDDNNNTISEVSEERATDVDQSRIGSEPSLNTAPQWTLSAVVTEKKSVFVARAARVFDTSTARSNVQHLLATDKKAAKATHNMTAWRMRNEETGVVYRDCDDDGESAAGSRLLHLLELMDVWNVMVVVTRWYGGIHLGSDRFRIINSVARDAIVKAGLTAESQRAK